MTLRQMSLFAEQNEPFALFVDTAHHLVRYRAPGQLKLACSELGTLALGDHYVSRTSCSERKLFETDVH